MRILMLNGSPRPAGATAAMLAALARGMRAAGARPARGRKWWNFNAWNCTPASAASPAG
jgi:hypothetical protein